MFFGQKSYLSSWVFILSLIAFAYSGSAVAQSLSLAPTTTYPSSLITDQSPVFQWSLVEGAESYEFALMNESESVTYFKQAGIQGNSFLIAGAVFDRSKAYHWKVRAFGSDGQPGPWSLSSSFLIYEPAAVPKAVSPAGYITTAAPSFEWAAISSAVAYDLWILSDDELTTIDMIGGITTNSYQRPSNQSFVPYTVYHYRVRSLMPDGSRSIWSEPGSFMVYSPSHVPQLLGPKGFAASGETLFSWMPVDGALSYELKVTSQDESQVLLSEANLAVNGYVLRKEANLPTGVVYHWRVRAVLGNGNRSIWSEAMSFHYYNPALVPSSLTPFGYITTDAPVLEWTQVSSASYYEIFVSEGESGNVIYSASVSGNTSLNLAAKIQLNPEVVYEWKVRAVFANESRSIWSESKAFKITSSAWDGSVTGLETDLQFVPVQTVKFSWLPLGITSLGPLRYNVVFRAEPANSSHITLWTGDSNTATPNQVVLPADVPLSPNSQYAWFVRAFTQDGTLIGISKKVVFMTPAESLPADPNEQVAVIVEEYEEQVEEIIQDNQTEEDLRVKMNLSQLQRVINEKKQLEEKHTKQILQLEKVYQGLILKTKKNKKAQAKAKSELAAKLKALKESHKKEKAEIEERMTKVLKSQAEGKKELETRHEERINKAARERDRKLSKVKKTRG